MMMKNQHTVLNDVNGNVFANYHVSELKQGRKQPIEPESYGEEPPRGTVSVVEHPPTAQTMWMEPVANVKRSQEHEN